MTTDKARKRAIRARMEKTGERYAAARRNVMRTTTDTTISELPPRVAEPGMSEAAILKGTGRTWHDWFRVLDAWDATTRKHTEIARYVNGEHGIDGWWSQSVTVAYERARGMRAPNERPEGFEVSVSRTVPLAAMEAWRAFVEPGRRRRWLDLALRMRTGTRTMGRSARFDVPDEGNRINVYFTPKDDERTTVTVTHVKLAGAGDVATHRAAWKTRLDELARVAASAGVARRPSRAS